MPAPDMLRDRVKKEVLATIKSAIEGDDGRLTVEAVPIGDLLRVTVKHRSGGVRRFNVSIKEVL